MSCNLAEEISSFHEFLGVQFCNIILSTEKTIDNSEINLNGFR